MGAAIPIKICQDILTAYAKSLSAVWLYIYNVFRGDDSCMVTSDVIAVMVMATALLQR